MPAFLVGREREGRPILQGPQQLRLQLALLLTLQVLLSPLAPVPTPRVPWQGTLGASYPTAPPVRVRLIRLPLLLVIVLAEAAASVALLLVCAMAFSRLPQLWLAVMVFE